MFFIRGERTEVIIDNLSFIDNVVERIWNGVNIAQGATLAMSGAEFRGNTQVLVSPEIVYLPGNTIP